MGNDFPRKQNNHTPATEWSKGGLKDEREAPASSWLKGMQQGGRKWQQDHLFGGNHHQENCPVLEAHCQAAYPKQEMVAQEIKILHNLI